MTRRGRRWGAYVTTALGLVAMGAVAESAAAKVTFSGIGDVRLGMAESDVRDEIGPPSATNTSRNRGARVLHYRRHKMEVVVETGESRVVGIKTTSRAQRTSSGLGVGSSEAEVRRKLRGEKCSTALGLRVCTVERGGTVLDFEVRRGKVSRVSLARAEDL